MTSWHLNAGSVTPALRLSPIGVILLPSGTGTQPGWGSFPDTNPGCCLSGYPRKLSEACRALVTLLVPVEEVRVSGRKRCELMAKERNKQKRFASR